MDQWSGASSLPLESTQPAFQFNSIQLDAPLFDGMFFSPPVKNNPKEISHKRCTQEKTPTVDFYEASREKNACDFLRGGKKVRVLTT